MERKSVAPVTPALAEAATGASYEAVRLLSWQELEPMLRNGAIETADPTLYDAKQSGRNRVVTFVPGHC